MRSQVRALLVPLMNQSVRPALAAGLFFRLRIGCGFRRRSDGSHCMFEIPIPYDAEGFDRIAPAILRLTHAVSLLTDRPFTSPERAIRAAVPPLISWDPCRLLIRAKALCARQPFVRTDRWSCEQFGVPLSPKTRYIDARQCLDPNHVSAL